MANNHPLNIGRPTKYNPTELGNKFIEYIDFVIDNPITIEVITARGDNVKQNKLRPMTVQGFCVFAEMGSSTFYDYKDNSKYSEIISRIEDFIHDYLFNRAAIGEFKDNLIARKLQLAEKNDTNLNMSKPIVINNPYDPNAE